MDCLRYCITSTSAELRIISERSDELEPSLSSENEARIAADEAVSGFEPVSIALDRDGRGGLLRDAAGRVLLLRPHGVHFAGRLLTPLACASIEGDRIVIDTAENRFGSAHFAVDDPSAWVRAIEALKS